MQELQIEGVVRDAEITMLLPNLGGTENPDSTIQFL